MMIEKQGIEVNGGKLGEIYDVAFLKKFVHFGFLSGLFCSYPLIIHANRLDVKLKLHEKRVKM